MKLIKKIAKWIGCILLIPVVYLLISFICTAITVNSTTTEETPYTIYLSTNGVHLDIIMPTGNIQDELSENLKDELDNAKYLSFGWGDENFYLHTRTWDDLTFSNAFSAMFLKSSTLMHVTKYNTKRSSWVAIQISISQLTTLNSYIEASFQKDTTGNTIKLEGEGYGVNDIFYRATGSYSCLKTCNTWVNQGFKESKIKACLWTPFDDGLLNKHKI